MTTVSNTTEFPVSLRNIWKRFPGVQALSDVDFDLRHGEVHAVVGENGAGKSTLIKILSGVYRPDSGSYTIDGRSARVNNPHDAIAAGISVVYQELKLIPNMSIAENIFFGRLPTKSGRIDWGCLYEKSVTALNEVGLSVDPRLKAQYLGVGQQQLIEIAHALTQSARVLIMDEPTSALSPQEIERLFSLILRLKKQGVATVYVSHKLQEILDLSDRVSVLRDGKLIRTAPTVEFNRKTLIKLMVGRSLDRESTKIPAGTESVAIELHGLSTAQIHEVSLRANSGEIVGLFGLMGAGRTELARAIVGIDQRLHGRIEIHGQSLKPNSPAAAKRLGVGMMPENRRTDGLFPEQSVLHNMTIAALERYTRRCVIDPSQEREAASQLVKTMSIRTPSLQQRIAVLSGGNQQKVIMARWLLKDDLKVLIVDEPTRGIDIGAKVEIYQLLREMAGRGLAMIVISSEMPELLDLCNRIYVMKNGRLTAEFSGNNNTQENLLASAI